MTTTTSKGKKASYVDERASELADIDKHIEAAKKSVIETKTETKVAVEAKTALETKLTELQKLRKDAAERLEKIGGAAEEAWEHLREETEYTWRALRASVHYFRSYFRDR